MEDRRMKWPRRSFTLVELLVVIAIIAVLMAILLPALAGIKGKGQQLVCSGNMRQVFNAFQYYADDNADFLPPVVDWDGAALSNWWDQTRIWSVIYDKTWVWDNGKTFYASVFSCPTTQAKGPATASSHQAMNSAYLQAAGAIDALHAQRRSVCAIPSRTLMIAEGSGRHVWPANFAALFFFHGNNNLSNANYFDGHGGSVGRQDYILDPADTFWRGK